MSTESGESHCSSTWADPDDANTDGTPRIDGGTQQTDAGTSDAGTPGAKGIQLTVDGVAYALETTPAASLGGNGYSIRAAAIDGAALRSATLLIVKAELNGAAAKYVVPTPGDYDCSATVPTPPYQWARIQYSGPEGTFQYGSQAKCVTITAFGETGAAVTGSFRDTLDRATATGPARVTVQGTFDVNRANEPQRRIESPGVPFASRTRGDACRPTRPPTMRCACPACLRNGETAVSPILGELRLEWHYGRMIVTTATSSPRSPFTGSDKRSSSCFVPPRP